MSNCLGLNPKDKVNIHSIIKGENLSDEMNSVLDYLSVQKGSKFYRNIDEEKISDDIIYRFERKYPEFDYEVFKDAFDKKIMDDPLFARRVGIENDHEIYDGESPDISLSIDSNAISSYKELILSKFKNFQTGLNKLNDNFKRTIYSEILIDFESGEFHDAKTAFNNLELLKKVMHENVSGKREELDKLRLSSSEPLDSLLTKSGNEWLSDYYLDVMMADNFDILLRKHFGNLFFKDGEGYAKNDDQNIRSGWQNEKDFNDAMDAMNAEMETHLFNTPVITVINKKGSDPEYVATGEYLDKRKLKKIVAENGLHEGTNINGVLIKKLKEDAQYDPYLAALYYRYFSPDPIIIRNENGEKRVQHSMMSMALKYKNEGRDYEPLVQIITNLTSHISGTVRNHYLDVNKDGLVKKSISSRTKTEIMGHVDENLKNRLAKISSRLKVEYNEKNVPVKVNYRDGRVEFILDKNKIKISKVNGQPASKLPDGAYKNMLNLFGIDTTSLTKMGFFDMYNLQFNGLDSLNPYLFHLFVTTDLNANHLNDLDLKERLKGAGLSEKALEPVYKKIKKEGFISPNAWNTKGALKDIKFIYDIVNGTEVRDKILNYENSLIPVYGEKAPVHEMPNFIKQISNSPELMKTSVLRNNAFVGNTPYYQIEQFAYLDGYQKNEYDKHRSHVILGVDDFTDLNINKLFGGQLLNSNFRSSYLTFYIPSEKRRYPIPLINRESEFLPIRVSSKGNKLDTRILFDEYINSVGKHHLNMISKTLDIWNSHLINTADIKKPFKNIRELKEFLDANDVPRESLYKLPFVENLDFIIKEDGANITIRPDMVEFDDIFSSKKRATEYIKFHLDNFVNQLSGKAKPIEGETTGRSVKFKIDREINKAIAERFGKKWAKGDLKIDGEINPFISGYFLHYLTISQNLTGLHLGSPFQYKPGKNEILPYPEPETKNKAATDAYYNSLKAYMHNSVIDMTKRAPSLSSVYYQPVIEKMDEHGRPQGLYTGLPEKSRVFYFKDMPQNFHSLLNGHEVSQDKYDGAFFMHPLELIRFVNSYGGKFSGMDSNIIKDVASIFDENRGVLQYEKKASFKMSLELMRLSEGNGKFDMAALNKIMLSKISYKPVVEYFEDGLRISQRVGNISELQKTIMEQTGMDENSALNKATEILKSEPYKYSLREDGKVWPVVKYIKDGKDDFEPMENAFHLFSFMGGYQNNNVWHDMIKVEDQNPDIAYQYVGKLGSSSAVKTGMRYLNENLYDGIKNDGEDLVFAEVSNKHTGSQLNPKHNPSDNEKGLSITTQKFQTLALNSDLTPETDKVYDAIHKLTNHLKSKIPSSAEELNRFIRKEILSESKEFNTYVEKLSDNTWSFNDRSIFRKIYNKINKIYERSGIRHKFNGGMFVVTPVTDIVMLHDLPDGRSVTHPEFLDWLETLPAEERVKYENQQPRNLHWSSYYKIDPKTKKAILDSNGKTIELQDQPEWNRLKDIFYLAKDIGKEDANIYSRYKDIAEQAGVNPVPEESFTPEDINELRKTLLIHYKDLLDTGEWYERPSEVVMPNLYKKEFQFGKNETVYLGEIKNDPYYFLKRRLNRKLNLDAVLYNIEDVLISHYGFKEDSPDLNSTAFQIWKIAHEENPRGNFEKKYRDEINYLKKKPFLLNNMKDNPINIDQLVKLRDEFLTTLTADNARIPGTGFASVNVIKIAAFMESLDNAIGIPVESMYVKGEDLDIDKGNVQIFERSRHPDTRGKKFDSYVWITDENGKRIKAKNDYSGEAMTLDEVRNNFPEDFERNNELYKNKDWYEAGLKNYITGKTIELLSDGRNALDSNMPIGLEKSKSFAENKAVDDYFSQDNPLYLSFLSTINKVGSRMIGIEATGLKGFSAIFHAAQKMIDRGEIVNNLVRAEKTKKPVLFDMLFEGKDYTSIANTSDLNRIKVEMALSHLTTEQLELAKTKLEQLKRESSGSEKAVEAYSELINAATDNAKHLVLGRINVNPFTTNMVSAMIATGIPYSKVIRFVNSDEFVKLTDVLENYSEKIISDSGKVIEKKMNLSLSPFSMEKYPPEANKLIKILNDKFKTSITDWIDFSDKFSTIAINLGVNQGLEVRPEDYYKLSRRINKALKSYLGRYASNPITIEDYFSSSPTRQRALLNRLESKTGRFNLLRIIEENPHFKGFYETMVESTKAINKLSPVAASTDLITDKTLEEFGNSILKFTDETQLHKNAEDLIYKLMGDQYMQKIGVLHTIAGDFDLNSISGRVAFNDSFDKIVTKLREKYPGNGFISKLNKFTDNFPGTNHSYSIYGVGQVKNMESSVFDNLKSYLSSLEQNDIKTLFVYNLSNGLAKRYGFEDLFMPENIRDWNDVLKSFKGFKDVHPDAVSYFLNSNPYTYKYLSFEEYNDFMEETYRDQDAFYSSQSPDSRALYSPLDKRIKIFDPNKGSYQFKIWDKKKGDFVQLKIDQKNTFQGIPFKATSDMSNFYSVIEVEGSKDFKQKQDIITTIKGIIKADMSNEDPLPRNDVMEPETGKNIYYIASENFHSGIDKSSIHNLVSTEKIFVTSKNDFRKINRKIRNSEVPVVKGERFILEDGSILTASLNIKPKKTVVNVGDLKLNIHSFIATNGKTYFMVEPNAELGSLVNKLNTLEEQRDNFSENDEIWKKKDKEIQDIKDKFIILNYNAEYGYAIPSYRLESMKGIKKIIVDEDAIRKENPDAEERNKVLLNIFDPKFSNIAMASTRVVIDKKTPKTEEPVKKPVTAKKNTTDVVTRNVVESFADAVGQESGIPVRTITSSEIRSNPEISNAFLSKKGFVLNNKLYLNVDNASLEDPIHELSHLWLNIIKVQNPNLHSLLLNTFSNHPIVKEVMSENPGLEGEALQEEVFAESIGKKIYKDSGLSNLQDGDVNAYINSVNDILNRLFIKSIGEEVEKIGGKNNLIGRTVQKALKKEGDVFGKLKSFSKKELNDVYGDMVDVTKQVEKFKKENSESIKRNIDCN